MIVVRGPGALDAQRGPRRDVPPRPCADRPSALSRERKAGVRGYHASCMRDGEPAPDLAVQPRLGVEGTALHYIEEAFAARVDDALAGNPTPPARDPAERRILAFAHRLDRAALASTAQAGVTLKFN